MSGSLLEKDKFSLYIHIPFCRTKCPYCHFFVVKEPQSESAKERLKDDLLSALIRELDLNFSSFPLHKKLVSIYWGGGTPALFGPHRVKKFLDEIKKRLLVMEAEECEITLEANPESIDYELLAGYQEAGINRLSLGVQSFHDKELLLLGRDHTRARIESVIHWGQRAGIDNISIDLMYDLPGQALEQWRSSLQAAFSLPITHLSLYNLTIEPRTLFFKKREELEKSRPSEEISLKMYLEAQRIASAFGFEQYEISAFSKPGFRSHHNSGYWSGREFYGFGPSAYSFLNNRRFSNKAHFLHYLEQMRTGAVEYEEIDSTSPQERVQELFCVGLRLFDGVDLSSLLHEYGVELSSDFYRRLSMLQNEGFITRFTDKNGSTRYTLSPQGRMVYDSIAVELI